MYTTKLTNYFHSFVIPYHSNKELLLRSLRMLIDTLPSNISKEIIIVANNRDKSETMLDIPFQDCRVISVEQDLLYARAVNIGVNSCNGDIVTLCDEDIFYLPGWYEPLFEKFISSDKIGSVSCKMLNPCDNTILDFGIDFALYNNVHPTRGLPWNHPYAMFDREVQAFCSAILMTAPNIFKKINGMDPCMAYVCCDTDFGIKINQQGMENWVVYSSMIYHKGISSINNIKSTRYSYLASDARAMFYAKDYSLLKINLPEWLKTTVQIFCKTHKLFQRYILVNLSSYTSAEWFIDNIKEILSIEYLSVYTYNPYERQSAFIELYDRISLNLIDSIGPIIYFVDEVKCLRQNAIWKCLRDTGNDIAIDINGSILSFNEIDSLYANIPPLPVR
ncbi:MAG: glycosyltransferase family 2 protein [Lachnospiraceae bacterium]|nr:glycosyltransferase family 2 protein [Lachnospiraceae bacterium]